jgi:glycosyltransferase involved in cell wall biosynthesis
VPLYVVFIHPSRTKRGGIVNAALAHALALSRRGHRVELWTASEPVAEKAAALGLTVFHKGALSVPSKALRSPAVLAALLRLRKRRVDAIVHHGARLLLPALLAAPPSAQFAVFHNEKSGGRSLFRNWLALSKAHASELDEFARRKRLRRTISVVPNALLEMPADVPAAPRPAAEFAAPLRIGVLAELKRHKGVDLLLRAAWQAVEAGLAVELHIGGTGPERDGLAAEAARLGMDGRIVWHGWVEALDPFFARFDVLCVPSRREPFGLVLIEAMARGKVVVSTATCGPSDIIENGQTGYLVPIDDSRALAARLQEIAAAPEPAAEVAAAGRRHALKAYSLDAAGARLEAALTGALRFWRS